MSISKLATIPLASADEALALSRGLFRDLIKTVKSTREFRSTANNRATPEYGRQTVERLAPIESFLKKRKGDTNPREMVAQAVRTGTLDGKKLSSQERRDLGARLKVLDMFATGDVRPTFSKDINYVTEPSDILAVRSSYPSRNYASRYDDIARNKPSALRDMARNRALYLWDFAGDTYKKSLQDLTFSNRYNLDEIINKALTGYKSSISMKRGVNRGRGYLRGIEEKYRDKMYNMKELADINRELVKQNVTDPRVTETVQALFPDWNGTLEELVALGRMLNP
jgi:hypothetical protein